MATDANPVLSIIVRRFRPEFEADIMRSLGQLQKAAADQPGYLGDHNSLTRGEAYCELVNVFAFDSPANQKRWEGSDTCKRLLGALERHPQETRTQTQLAEFASLLHPKSLVSRAEVVVILIFWIVVWARILDVAAAHLLPATFDGFARSVLLISINVVLISYLFLPWSSTLLTRLKRRAARRARGK